MKKSLTTRLAVGLALATTLVGLLTACSDDDTKKEAAAKATGTIQVYAAASLTDAFTEIKADFEKENPDAEVVLNFQGSSTLATQINQGAPADVFASANESNMDKITDLAVDPKLFASNTLVIITAPGNPKGISSLADLANPDLDVALCAAEQPCGAAALSAEEAAGITITPATSETSVTGVVTKVTTGEADAGLVYVTDATAAKDDVDTVDDPVFASIINDYPITVVSTGTNTAGAQAFVDYVLSTKGQSVLEKYGFGKP